MNIDAGYLSYIIKDIQYIKEYEENISNIICQYAKLNLWEYKDIHYCLYDCGYHLCVKEEGILPDRQICHCIFDNWQEFIDRDIWLYEGVWELLTWDWLSGHSDYCQTNMYNKLRIFWKGNYICDCLQGDVIRGHNDDCCLIMKKHLGYLHYCCGCECLTWMESDILQLLFMSINSADHTEPSIIFAKIKVLKDDEPDIRKFINKHTSERSINV